MEKIDLSKVVGNNFCADPHSEIIFYNSRVLRKIYPESEKLVKGLMDSGLIQELIKKGLLISTKYCNDLYMDGCNILLEHKKVEHVTYPSEWTFHMLKDAANLVLEINKIAIRYGYELRDPHPYNILFVGCSPVYIDFGSFFKIDGSSFWWNGEKKIQKSYEFPLYVWSKRNMPYVAMKLNEQICSAIPNDEKFRLLHPYCPIFIYELLELYYKIISRVYAMIYSNEENEIYGKSNIKKWFYRLKRYDLFQKDPEAAKHMAYIKKRWLKRIVVMQHRIQRLENKDSYRWSRYQEEYFDSKGIVQKNDRFRRIAEFVKEIGVETVLEIGGNAGAISQYLLENKVIRFAICTDYDKTAVDLCYQRCKRNHNLKKKILPCILNILSEEETAIQTRADRLKCEMLVALALTHHLLLAQKCKLQYLVDIFSLYTTKYLLVEFMPLGLWDGKNKADVPEWYNLDWFCEGLNRKFYIDKIEQLEKNRILILARKRQ